MSKVLVIGGGVIGLCCAYYAAQKGHEVTILDRDPEDQGGCSLGNAGMIVPSHFIPLAAPGVVALGLKWMWNPESPFWIKPRLDWDLISWGLKFWRASTPAHVARSAPLLRDLHLISRACFEELDALPGNDFGLVKRGLLMLCKTDHALAEEAATAEKARELGVPTEVLNAAQTSALDPNVTMDIAGSVYFPKDCHLDPGRFLSAIKSQLRQLGVRFAWNTEVLKWRLERNRIKAAQTLDHDFEAAEFVLCGGSWSPLVAKQLGLGIPIQAGKGYSLTLPHPRQLPGICSIFSEARVAVTPIGSRLRFGGTMEMSGLNHDINTARVHGIIKAVPKYYPAFQLSDFEGIPPWHGLRPCSPDGMPYIGRTQRFANLLIATGHSMMGLSLAPVTGKLIGQILSGEKPPRNLQPLSPDRYS